LNVVAVIEFIFHRFPWRLPRLLVKAAAVVVICVAALVYLNLPTLREFVQTRQQRDAYRESVTSMKQEYEALLREQAQLQSGDFAMEKAIRERLLMVRRGEEVLFIESADGSAGEPARPALPAPNP
jgi:cell division protein FtsB